MRTQAKVRKPPSVFAQRRWVDYPRVRYFPNRGMSALNTAIFGFLAACAQTRKAQALHDIVAAAPRNEDIPNIIKLED